MTRLLLAALITLASFQPVTSQTPTDTTWMMVQHDVADLEAWRDVFAARAVSPASRFLPASMKSFDHL